MKRLKADFSNSTEQKNDTWYDLREDWALIEASIASQYGIRLRQSADMPWSEFTNLITGLLPDTPLGAIIKIRSEDDPEMLKQFTSDQIAIHNKWRDRQSLKQLDDPDTLERNMEQLTMALEKMFG